MVFRRRLLQVETDRLLICKLFSALIITLTITSSTRIVRVLLLPLENFKNSTLTPMLLLFQLVFGSSSKIFNALLTRVPAAKDVAQ